MHVYGERVADDRVGSDIDTAARWWRCWWSRWWTAARHSATYNQNKEYIDVKITGLKYEDDEVEDLSTNGLAL